MAISNKPFNWAEHIRRTVFIGRPAYFNAKDLNKQVLIQQNFLEDLSQDLGVYSELKFSALSVGETIASGTVTRTINVTYTGGIVFIDGVKFTMPGGSINKVVTFPVPATTNPITQYPPSYIYFKAEFEYITYADDPDLCGITGSELPTSVRSVDIERYIDPSIDIFQDAPTLGGGDIGAILATIYPKYDEAGTKTGYKIFNNAHNYKVTATQGAKVTNLEYDSNGSMAEKIEEIFKFRFDKVSNERQLIRRFNVSDVASAPYTRHNIGFSNVVNHAQLVKNENLKDIPDVENARFHLGLGNAAHQNFGNGENDVLRGNQLPVGLISMWSGNPNAIPANWAICDGTQGTPDLRGRFIVGYANADTDYNVIGKVGGEKAHTLTINEMPSHDHSGSTGDIQPFNGSTTRGTSDDFNGHNTGNAAAEFGFEDFHHKHSIPSQGGGAAHENRPPYYTLAFIMYLGRTEPTPPVTAPNAQATLSYPNFSVPNNTTSGGFTNNLGVIEYEYETAPEAFE